MCDSILCLKYRKYSSLCYQAQRRPRRSISCLGYSKRLKCKAPLIVPRGRREDDTTEGSTFMTDTKIISTKQMSWSFAFQCLVWFHSCFFFFWCGRFFNLSYFISISPSLVWQSWIDRVRSWTHTSHCSQTCSAPPSHASPPLLTS